MLLALILIFAGWRTWRRLRYFLHIFQLEGYKLNEFRAWLGSRGRGLLATPSHGFGAALLALLAASGEITWIPLAIGIAWMITFASAWRYLRAKTKKPLAFTNRMKRLTATAGLVTALPVVIGVVGFVVLDGWPAWAAALAGHGLADLGVPLWVYLAGLINTPIEQSVQNGFKQQAKNHLASRPDLTVIGITGSYGKTSVKFAVAELLKQRFNVLATPGSYNTPMGICLVVNNKLQPQHQMLVLEMGARYTGDIRELCELAQPDISIVTSVGIAHLETMGPIENIARVKGELVRHMKPGGPVILNGDDHRVLAMRDDAQGPVYTVSTGANPEADFVAGGISYGPDGARFLVRDTRSGEEAEFTTQLLGRHNVLNVLLAVAVGSHFGLRLRQMAYAAGRLEPVEHRLQLRQQGPLTVIDDAFNSNPVGARNAVEILGQFTTGRRILITPGMVELGERQETENQAFGTYAASHIDLALLVGDQQTRPIQTGLREAGFPEADLHVFDSLFDAQAYLNAHARPGDVVLYENDLPDQYG